MPLIPYFPKKLMKTKINSHILTQKEVFCLFNECMLSCFSCVWLCNPMDRSLAGSSVHGILQARILEWVAMPSSKGSFWPRDQTQVSFMSCTGTGVLSCPVVCGIFVPWPGIKPSSPALEGGFLTTGFLIQGSPRNFFFSLIS